MRNSAELFFTCYVRSDIHTQYLVSLFVLKSVERTLHTLIKQIQETNRYAHARFELLLILAEHESERDMIDTRLRRIIPTDHASSAVDSLQVRTLYILDSKIPSSRLHPYLALIDHIDEPIAVLLEQTLLDSCEIRCIVRKATIRLDKRQRN